MKGSVVGAIVGVLLFFCLAGGGWYYFVDTLRFSEIAGESFGPRGTILVNLFDFDTGLTRHDLHNLKTKAAYWEGRIRQVSSITDPALQQQENEKLAADMMQDPAMKKVVQKVFRFGGEAVLSLIGAVGGD